MRRISRALAVTTLLMTVLSESSTGQQPSSVPANPLEVRVTINYRNRPALEVLQVLTQAAGLTSDVASGTLLPVSIAMTNVRLETALSALCESASCQWSLNGGSVAVIPIPIDAATQLPPTISIALAGASIREVFQGLAAALHAQLELEGELPTRPVSITFRNAPPANVLNFLAQTAGCSWRFEPGRLIIKRLP